MLKIIANFLVLFTILRTIDGASTYRYLSATSARSKCRLQQQRTTLLSSSNHGYYHSARQQPYLHSFRVRNDRPTQQLVRPVVRFWKRSRKTNEQAALDELSLASQHHAQLSHADLSPLGKVVAGTVEVCIATALEYVTGFAGGYAIGAITDVPRLLFTSVDAKTTLLGQVGGRALRMHQKSAGWAHRWGGMSATFAAARVGTKLLRGGREDEWNNVFSSMAAGAWFARKEGPQAMIRGAALYGVMIYVISGPALRGKQATLRSVDMEFL